MPESAKRIVVKNAEADIDEISSMVDLSSPRGHEKKR
jgi:hypothetical protein